MRTPPSPTPWVTSSMPSPNSPGPPGKRIDLSISTSAYSRGFKGSASPVDAAELLQLVHALFTCRRAAKGGGAGARNPGQSSIPLAGGRRLHGVGASSLTRRPPPRRRAPRRLQPSSRHFNAAPAPA